MNTPTVLTSLLIAVGTATAITLFAHPDAAPALVPDSRLTAAELELEQLGQRVAGLQRRLDEVTSSGVDRPAAAPQQRTQVPAMSHEQVAAGVEAYLKQRGGAAIGRGEAPSLEATFERLNGTNYWEQPGAWRKARAAGRMDELIEMFELAAKAFPNDVDKQMALADAYLAYVQVDGTKWALTAKADQQFDRVLAIDDRHWRARFSKAMSYTFWPDIHGKKPEAISHFGILVEQQDSLPVEDRHAQTYLFLGNLLEGKDPARAREVWQRGARRHPNDEELRRKVKQ
jgi:hypothetical protein